LARAERVLEIHRKIARPGLFPGGAAEAKADGMVDIRTVGVIGAGQMGSGIAHVCALGGYEVRLNDLSRERIDAGIGLIHKNMVRQVSRGLIEEAAMDAAMALIKPAESLADIGSSDLAIEAATEDESLKKAIFKSLAPHMSDKILLASNTSSISITRLASSTDRPERFIGLHFMNPAPVMKLVEIIRGIATDVGTYETAVNFARSLGKTTANAEDFPAFIVNRILVPMINEAIYTLYEGVGTVEAIDTAMHLGANHPMGPLELGDFIGLDTVLSIMNVLYDGLADSKYRPCPLLVKYVEAGWLGRKAGRGFYDYRGEKPIPTR
jgi:3-hydroxybutyryl-CoA dehydrogenase